MSRVVCPSCGWDDLTASLNTDAPIPGAGSGRYASVYDGDGRPIGDCPGCEGELDARALLGVAAQEKGGER